jgi:hypothetical protein
MLMMSQSGGGTLVGMDICVFSSCTNDTPKYSIANRNIGQPYHNLTNDMIGGLS